VIVRKMATGEGDQDNLRDGLLVRHYWWERPGSYIFLGCQERKGREGGYA